MPHTTDSCHFAASASPSSLDSTRLSQPAILTSLPRLAQFSRVVDRVVASWHAAGTVAEQRGWHRARYDRAAILTPLDDQTGEPGEVHKIVSGRDISPSGFSFTHLDPLACRRAIITFAFENEIGPWDAVLLRLTWCRFTRAGIYQSGGKFLNVVPSPLSGDQTLGELPYA